MATLFIVLSVIWGQKPTYHHFDHMNFLCLVPKQNTNTDPGLICLPQQLEEDSRNFSICSGNGGANGEVWGQSWNIVVVLSKQHQRAKIFDQILVPHRILPSKASVNCLKCKALWEIKDNEEDFFHLHCQTDWWCECWETEKRAGVETIHCGSDLEEKSFNPPIQILPQTIQSFNYSVFQ